MDLTEEGEAEVAKFKSALRKMYKRQASLVLSFPNQLLFQIAGKSTSIFWEKLQTAASSDPGIILKSNSTVIYNFVWIQGCARGEGQSQWCNKSVLGHCLLPGPWPQRDSLTCASVTARSARPGRTLIKIKIIFWLPLGILLCGSSRQAETLRSHYWKELSIAVWQVVEVQGVHMNIPCREVMAHEKLLDMSSRVDWKVKFV